MTGIMIVLGLLVIVLIFHGPKLYKDGLKVMRGDMSYREYRKKNIQRNVMVFIISICIMAIVFLALILMSHYGSSILEVQ